MGLYRRKDTGRKGRIWWISYTDAGQQRRESTGFTNKKAAQKVLDSRKVQALEQRWNVPRSRAPHLSEFAEQFLWSISHENTRARYRSSISNLQRHLGNPRLSDIGPEHIFRFQQARMEEGAGKATINRDTATLSAMYSQAKKLRLVSQNPCRDIGKLNERRGRRQAKPLTYEEEEQIKKFCPRWLGVLITVLGETGLRVKKEALPLEWSDVILDSEPACIHVRDSKSAAGVRTVWLTKHCREILANWRLLFGPDFSRYVFPNPQNPGAHMVDYRKTWQRAARLAGLSDRRIYDMRATFATRANACHASGLTVAHLLGHSSTQVLPAYIKPLDEHTRAVIEAMDSIRASHLVRPNSVQ